MPTVFPLIAPNVRFGKVQSQKCIYISKPKQRQCASIFKFAMGPDGSASLGLGMPSLYVEYSRYCNIRVIVFNRL